jgi:hypothetical protein
MRRIPLDVPLRAALLLGLSIAGCKSQGPKNLAPDRFDYNAAIARSASEQMLLNLVRLRYTEVPVFLTVNSVLTQYVYTGAVTASGSWGASWGEPLWSVGAGGTYRYIERPTITYSPLSGREFAAQLVSPVPADLLFSLVQAGWPPELLMVMCVQRLNDLQNLPFSWATTPESQAKLEKFREAMHLFIEIAKREAVEAHRSPDDGAESYLDFAEHPDRETQALIDEFKDMVGLSRRHSSFRITSTIVGRRPDEVTVRVRSVLDLMGLLSQGVDVPELHLQELRTADIPAQIAEESPRLIPLHVRVQPEPPEGAFIAVEYEGFWFYIPHADQQSKLAFGLLAYLFEMQAPQVQGAGPIITIPTG